LLEQVASEVETFRLSFVRPFVHWLTAALALAGRDFGGCDRHLSQAERSMSGRYVPFHDLNLRSLWARMYLQTGRTDEAWECVAMMPGDETIPSMRGEYLATKALVAAVRGDETSALQAATEADSASAAVEVRAYTNLAVALLRFRAGEMTSLETPFRRASTTRTWDPMVTLLRSAPDFAEAAARWEGTQHMLRFLCERIDDRALARQTQLRIRTTGTTDDGLSQREKEVLGLIVQGFRNPEIARTLFIAESTVKVHVRHIFEKLGVRTRAEAAARFSSP
jgi:ATP/maltotriose-dependent transcriptional regulator MalT